MDLADKFDPVRYSEIECEFLVQHLGEAPVVAERSLHRDLAAKGVMEEIARVYALAELEKSGGPKWIGLSSCKAALQNYIDQTRKWRLDWERTKGKAPMNPSMYTYDSKGRPHWGGPGADSGIVKTYFDKQGNRHPFALDVYEDGNSGWTPEWVGQGVGPDPLEKGLKNDTINTRIECLICGHTEKYNTDSRSSYNAARGRISKHLRTAKTLVDEHRELHTSEFGG